MIRYVAISASFPSERLRIQCESFRKVLHDRDPAMNEIYDGIGAWYSEHIKQKKSAGEESGLAKFLNSYLDQVPVGSVLDLISTCGSDDWIGYLGVLEKTTKYFFSCEFLNYARLMPVSRSDE